MNKKLFTPLLAIFGIALVMAGGYYAITSYTISINQPIEVAGPTTQEFDCDAGDTCRGDGITISNDGDSSRDIVISDNAGSYPNAIDSIRYVGSLTLTEKDVDFSDDSVPWTIPSGANTVEVEYTVIGDTFEAEVVGDGLTGYNLYYYADKANRFNNVSKGVPISEIGSQDLPYSDDQNAEGGDYDYCEAGEYDTCHGAKLWYIHDDVIDDSGNIDWSQGEDTIQDKILFETKLIQYNSEGNLVVYPESVTNGVSADLTIYPEVDINKYATEGDRTLDVTIA